MPLLVPYFLAGHPCRAARASRPRAYSELASHCRRLHTADSTGGLTGVEDQRHRPSYTVSPTGQRLKRRPPLPAAAQAVGLHKKGPSTKPEPVNGKMWPSTCRSDMTTGQRATSRYCDSNSR